MNRTILFLLLLLFSGSLFFTSCANRNAETLSTELRINIAQAINGDSLVKEGVVVELYRNEADLQLRSLPVTSAKTNASGQVVFKNLRAVQYYVYAYIDEGGYRYDNSQGEYSLDEDLIEGSITVAKVYIAKSRPVVPTTMTLQYIEVLRFDTVNVFKTLGSHCSDSLRFFLKGYDSNGLAISSPLDSSYSYFYNGAGPYNYCNFCYERGNAPAYPVYYSVFNNFNVFNVSQYTGFSISVKLRKAVYPYNIYPFEGNGSSINVINFSDYFTGSVKPVYPTRFRLLEYPSSLTSIVNDRYIDAIVSWN
ncbi:MAG: hypothetical protein K2Q22_18050 [Cytophagales bacterium]|nr:hypothetical protein [Cytophagales bacterium]